MLPAADLIRLAELVKLAADTARAFGEASANGVLPKIIDAAGRMDVAANDLIEAAHEMDGDTR